MKAAFPKFLIRYWDALLASAVACIFIYLFTRHSGIGISPDSVMYTSTGTNIREHFRFADFNGLPLVDFPLGYPSFLALLSFLSGAPVLGIMPVLNAVLFSSVIFLTAGILNGYQHRSGIYKAAILSLLACSPCLLEVYAMAWSETLFLFWILLFIVAIYSYLQLPTYRNIVFAAVIAAFAFVTRYAGITVLGTGLFLVFFYGDVPLSKKIRHLFLFTVIGISLVAGNLLRNHSVTGNSTGVREKAIRTLTDNLQQIGGTVADWLPFTRGHETITLFLFILILIGGMVMVGYRLLQQQYYPFYETVVSAFFVVYALFLLVIATVSRFENLSSRLLSPLYLPMLLVGSSWLVGIVRKCRGVIRIMVLFIALVIFTGFHLTHYRLNAEAWEGIKDAGMPGYTEDSWTQSLTVAHLNKNKEHYPAPVYGNANDAVYFLTGIHALSLPHKEIQKEINAFLQHRSFYLVWFRDGENTDLVGLDFVKQHKKLVSAETLEDGSIYFFSDSTAVIPRRN
ncbi:MAG: hypothetical protein V4450_03970 [Bacteroidota bacterium]